MVGAMSGYEEPEWEEQTAYEALIDAVHMEFTDWGALASAGDEGEDSDRPIMLRDLSTPTAVFAAAAEMIAAARCGAVA